MREAVIALPLRTPIGRYGGALRSVRPDDLAAVVLRAIGGQIPAEQLDDIYLGCANQAGEDSRNVARMAGLLAGYPVDVPGVTVNRLCGSGLQAVINAALAVQTGAQDLVVAGGVESMSRAPWVMPKPDQGFARGPATLYDTSLGWRMVNPAMERLFPPISLGETAERVAARYAVSREDQDRFALESQQKAGRALAAGRFKREIVPVSIPQSKGEPLQVTVDEHPRPDVTLEQLARLRPAFVPEGTVTAGNSSGLNDGAAAMVVTTPDQARALGLTPLLRLVSWAVAGVHPDYMGIGPVPASRKALSAAGLEVDQLDVVELNEAFAAQAVACIRELGLNPARVNPNGGAIALGHPLGMSGARLVVSLAHELAHSGGRYGLATMCIGVGQGISAVFERIA